MTVHLVGTDLHLQGLVLGADHGCVEGAIEIALWGGNVVVEFLWDMAPGAVDDA